MKRVIEMQKGCRRCQGDVQDQSLLFILARRRQHEVRVEEGASKASDKLRGIRPPMTAL